jgi:hypothetical protein
MSTDRELLELAAKAAGYEFDSTEPFEIAVVTGGIKNYFEWNPLHNDGDALRLSVALGLNVFHTNQCAYALESDSDTLAEQKESYLDAGGPIQATRRVITRAAAEIGRFLTT